MSCLSRRTTDNQIQDQREKGNKKIRGFFQAAEHFCPVTESIVFLNFR